VVPSSLKKAIVFTLAFFALWIGVLLLQAQNETVTNQISEVQSQIDIAAGEKVRLTAELNSMFSNEKIDEYATKKLGMVKADSSQIIYIDLTEGDEILFSGDRTVSDAEDNGESKLKELFAYLFLVKNTFFMRVENARLSFFERDGLLLRPLPGGTSWQRRIKTSKNGRSF
jgi:cell division protein FtsL